MNHPGKSIDGLSHRYERLLERFSDQIGEPASSYGPASQNIREEIVRCLWFGSHFSPEELRTDEGARLEVLSPGWWNVEGGPDFMRAEILMEGAGRLVGDVEVHTRASSWYAHGHHKQPEYNDVCLHVVMWSEDQQVTVKREDGRPVPQLTLSDFLDEEIGELVQIVDLEGEDAEPTDHPVKDRFCGRALREGVIQPSWVGKLLDAAGDQRVISRSNRIGQEMQETTGEEVLCARIADALGYKNNRLGFRQLTSALPVSTVREIIPQDGTRREKGRAIEAACYGIGGFLDTPLDDADEETRLYVDELRGVWDRLPKNLRQNTMTPDHWHFGGTRPVNFPTRRIAALAGLYARHLPDGLLGTLTRTVLSAKAEGRRRLDTTIRDALTGLFTEIEHPYWSHRYSLGGKRLGKARALVGSQRAKAILVDVLIPSLFARARTTDTPELARRIEGVWAGLPRRQPNTVVRRMKEVIFGESPGIAGEVIDSARRQQGLHQIHNDFCAARTGCSSCVIWLASRSDHPMTAG